MGEYYERVCSMEYKQVDYYQYLYTLSYRNWFWRLKFIRWISPKYKWSVDLPKEIMEIEKRFESENGKKGIVTYFWLIVSPWDPVEDN